MDDAIAIVSQREARAALARAWPTIRRECIEVLGSELHYQAMIYFALRTAGAVPVSQLGMNVKQWIPDVQTDLFRKFDLAKHEAFRGGFEPVPDVVIFSPAVEGDWRRRQREKTLSSMLLAIEVKASERAGARLSRAELERDVLKLAAHRGEVRARGHDFHPVMMVIDSAPTASERVRDDVRESVESLARSMDVEWLYAAPDAR
jgi:hypothetical protein